MNTAFKHYTLSEYERLALENRVNLSDGHAKHELSKRQRAIVGRTLELLDISFDRHQSEIEEEFKTHFFRCAGQNMSSDQSVYLSFSSSSAIKMAAQYCRLRGLSIHLLEPCFDNIHHIIKSEGLNITPVHEGQLQDPETLASLLSPNAALWIVQPNNPTGMCLDRELFTELIRKVAERKATIIIDFCFRFFSESLKGWHQYEILKETNVNYICFEDTGKTWSLADTKVGITVCSKNSSPIIYGLHDELLLNVSPLHLLLLNEFIKDTLANGFYETVGKAVEANRQIVHTLVEKGVVLHGTQHCRNLPVELLRLKDETPATVLWSELRQRGVDVLPAHNYFWSRPFEGATSFRIPLSRPQRQLEAAVPIIEQTIRDLGKL